MGPTGPPGSPDVGGSTGQGGTPSGWDATFPKQPSEDVGPLLGPMASLPNPFISQAATQVGLNGQINSSPESIENVSEIPLSRKGVSPVSPQPPSA